MWTRVVIIIPKRVKEQDLERTPLPTLLPFSCGILMHLFLGMETTFSFLLLPIILMKNIF